MPTKKTTSTKPKNRQAKNELATTASKEVSVVATKELAAASPKGVSVASPKGVAIKENSLAKIEPKKGRKPGELETADVIEMDGVKPKKVPAKKVASKKVPASKASATKKPVAKKSTTAKSATTKKTTATKVVATKPVTVAKKLVPTKLSKKHILLVGSECLPFAGTGGLGEVLGSLPKAINSLSSDVKASVILPLYESIEQEYRDEFEFIASIYVPVAWRKQYAGLFKYACGGVDYYFVDNEYYFKRPNIYGYYDDGERYAFFSRAVLELLPHVSNPVDVLHIHDWQTALVSIYYKLYYMYKDGYKNIKTIFTIHNVEYQGKYPEGIIEDVFGIDSSELGSVSFDGTINLVKAAIDYSDAVSTVSPSYASELEDAFYAHGLESVFRHNARKMRGILNGIDTITYDPATNKSVFKSFDAKTFNKKVQNKLELQQMLDLNKSADTPMVALISRLVCHKGLDLVRFAMDELLQMDIQIVILGKGEPDFEDYFAHIADMYPQKVAAIIAYNKDLSHKVYSAADMFLMPSKSEPCGLSQMMACRYGAVPIVRATGGLYDSITDCASGDTGNGFVFSDYDAASMLHAVRRAVGLYADYRTIFNALAIRCMTTDFSWNKSAKDYIKFYSEF